MLEILRRVGFKPKEVSSVGVLAYTGTLFSRKAFSWVVFVERADDPIGTVSLPAGWVEKGEDPRHAAVRELEEETGIKVLEGQLVEIVSSPRFIVGKGRAGIVNRIVYSSQITEDQLWGDKKDWEHGYALVPTQIKHGISMDFNRYVKRVAGHDEIVALTALSSNALPLLVAERENQYDLILSTSGFFKREIMKKLTKWARKQSQNALNGRKTA